MTSRLDRAGLDQLHGQMQSHVDKGEIAGLITLVAKGDDVSVDVVGSASFEDPTPLARDAIFRIASLSKPITAVAAMALLEDGTLSLDQVVDDLLPELADRRVLRSLDADLDDTVPAHRPITVEDLLSYRMGIGSIMAAPGTYPYQRAEAELGLQSIGSPPWPPVAHDDGEWMAALGTLPLIHQPGEQWLYATSGQVLGVLIARAAGKGLDEVLHERILGPLGMADTGFVVPAENLDRLTTFYLPDPDSGALSVLDDPADSWWARRPRFLDAAGWLVSTVDDYWAFVSMLLGGGSHRGVRVLSEASVALMTTDRLTAGQRAATGVFLGERYGWGLGLAVPPAGSSSQPLPYGIGWDGGSGTTWHSNQQAGTTGILLTQRALNSPEPPPAYDDFWAGAAAATR